MVFNQQRGQNLIITIIKCELLLQLTINYLIEALYKNKETLYTILLLLFDKINLHCINIFNSSINVISILLLSLFFKCLATPCKAEGSLTTC